MSELKLRVGGKYRNRKGEVVEIAAKRIGTFLFTDTNDLWYQENGRFNYVITDLDLIEEIKDESESKDELTLRDRIAISVLNGLLSAAAHIDISDKNHLAKLSYEMTDAMLEAREI